MTMWNLLCESLAVFNSTLETAATGGSFYLCQYQNSTRPREGYFWEGVSGFWALVKVPGPESVDPQGTLHNPSVSLRHFLNRPAEYTGCFCLTLSRGQKLMKFSFWKFIGSLCLWRALQVKDGSTDRYNPNIQGCNSLIAIGHCWKCGFSAIHVLWIMFSDSGNS